MDPTIPQGQAAIGGMDAVKQAMARRGFGAPTSPLDQVSPAAPSAPGAVPPQAPPTTSAMPPQPQMGGMPSTKLPGMGVGVGSPESTLIIKTLGERLKTLGQQGQ